MLLFIRYYTQINSKRNTSYTFTCDDQGENHAGMHIIGKEAKEVSAKNVKDIIERERVCRSNIVM